MTRSARLAACLLAPLAIASCTSSDRITPPAEVGGAVATPSNVAPVPGVAATASPAVAPSTTTAGPALPANNTTLSAEPAPAFSGPQPSASRVAAAPQGDGGPIPAAFSSASIQFAPITGTTLEAAAPLSQRLAARARERGIVLAGGAQPAYVLKGYFSEVTDGGATTVIYVWDVTDVAGNRLHRIQGQARTEGAGGWSAVSAGTMQAIADRTIDDLAAWLATRTG